MTIYHLPRGTNYNQPLCGQWSVFTELKISKVSPTCKKCIAKANKEQAMTIDNTQELDEILEKYGEYYHLKQLNRFSDSEMQLNFAEETDIVRAKQALLDWHNKQIEEVLGRLDSKAKWLAYDDSEGELIKAVDVSAIEAERNKLNNSDGDVK